MAEAGPLLLIKSGRPDHNSYDSFKCFGRGGFDVGSSDYLVLTNLAGNGISKIELNESMVDRTGPRKIGLSHPAAGRA
jgi:hypothetical protein